MPAARALGGRAGGPRGGGARRGRWGGGGEAPADGARRLPAGDRRLSERNMEIARVVAEVASDLGVPSVQVALAWLRARTGPVVIPIVGARRAAQLQESLGCLDVTLGDEHLDRLDEASRVSLGFPHDFLRALR